MQTPQKTPVSVLQELCTKKNVNPPFYETEAEDKIFTCTVTALGYTEYGSAPSKNIAKHLAATALLNKLSQIGEKIEDNKRLMLPITINAIGDLLNLCTMNNHPKPLFEITSASGTAHAPQFTIRCTVASIERSASHSTKKGAKQMAAYLMHEALKDMPGVTHDFMELDTFEKTATSNQEKQAKIFKTYLELKKEGGKLPGVKLSDRHNHLKELPQEKKDSIAYVFNDNELSDHEKIALICNGLEFKYQISDYVSEKFSGLMFQTLGGYDCVFIGINPNVLHDVVLFFKTMLHM